MSNKQKAWEAIEKATPVIMFLTFVLAIFHQIFG